jgi:ribosomal-protein-alanine N-acetyltransferase
MTTAMPVLETERLCVRPFVLEDLENAHLVLSRAWDEPVGEIEETSRQREDWLRWTVAAYAGLEGVSQPPYGERAVTLRSTGQLLGAVGVVPSIGPFGRLPGFPVNEGSPYWYPEVGLYWAIDPGHQGLGYATEAARAVIDFMFDAFQLGRIVATTEYSNERSMAVMRKLGMEILRNPDGRPPWFQVVGLLKR